VALLDTNLLLLWLVAQTDLKILSTFKRVQMFTPSDIDLLRKSMRRFPKQVTTPHILSETSNFIDQAPALQRSALNDRFRLFIQEVAEIYRPAATLVDREEFNILGLSDVGALEISTEVVVLTMDYKLSGKIRAMGGNALNFNEARSNDLLNQK
jgi:hypothetical protein